MVEPASEVTEDRLLDGRVRLRQVKVGYRAGLDAALLAAACDALPGERALDVGCGAGGALLAAAYRRPGTRFTGIERDPSALALARENIGLNGLEARVEARAGNVGRGFDATNLSPFDMALCNPPFFDDSGAMRAPHPARRDAYMAEDGLAAWIAFLLAAVRDGGRVIVVHRAERLIDLLAGLAPRGVGVDVRPVQPFADAPAKRLLLRAVKGGRAPPRLLPPLVLHERGRDGHTAAAEAILRGEADLPW
jgi:tRNA1(Val) A37 N6-methylase TrmN6